MRPLSSRLVPSALLALSTLSLACGDGGDADGGDSDSAGLTGRTGLYELSSWLDDVGCQATQSEFPPYGILVERVGDTLTQTPCASADSCDVVRDLWTTDVAVDGSGGTREVPDASYNQSADACQLFFGTRELTLNADGTASFERVVLTESYEAPAPTTDACRQLLEDWTPTGERSGCVSWQGTLVE